MAEATIRTTVCDLCGKPSNGLTLNFKDGTGSYQLDICSVDLRALKSKAHAPRRGRPAGSVATTRAKSTRKKSTRKKPTNGRRKKSAAKS